MNRNLQAIERETCAMVERHSARVVAVLLDDGQVTAFRPGLQGDEVAHELITLANRIRRELRKGDAR